MFYKVKMKDGSVRLVSLKSEDADIEGEILKWSDANDVLEFDVFSKNDAPISKNYRNAWTYDFDINLEKAKPIQKQLMIKKAHERIQADQWGNKDFSVVDAEITELESAIDAAKDLTELYNIWPASIELREESREYIVR